MNTTLVLTRLPVPVSQRMTTTAERFGIHFPLLIEPCIYAFTEKLSREYEGGYWQFYILSNGGFYAALDSTSYFQVFSPNGYECVLSADALGITACLFAYSQLSFSKNAELAESMAEQYYALREYAFEHPEAEAILGVID